jgi:hypothetical protein
MFALKLLRIRAELMAGYYARDIFWKSYISSKQLLEDAAKVMT